MPDDQGEGTIPLDPVKGQGQRVDTISQLLPGVSPVFQTTFLLDFGARHELQKNPWLQQVKTVIGVPQSGQWASISSSSYSVKSLHCSQKKPAPPGLDLRIIPEPQTRHTLRSIITPRCGDLRKRNQCRIDFPSR